MRKLTLTITAAAVALWSVAAVGGCGSDPTGEQPTTVSSGSGAGTTATGGTGGTGGATGNGGSGGNATTSSSTGGNGGSGGTPEMNVHGCLSTTAVDMTGMDPANIDIPGGNYCVVVAQGSTVTFTLGTPANHRPLGGFFDGQVKNQDATSPIVSCCDISPYDCCPAVTNPPFTMNATGAFPWYDDKNPDTIKGVVYVQ
jgi:hypothetical protein